MRRFHLFFDEWGSVVFRFDLSRKVSAITQLDGISNVVIF